jgi:thiol:disulfide interchange protein DsbC
MKKLVICFMAIMMTVIGANLSFAEDTPTAPIPKAAAKKKPAVHKITTAKKIAAATAAFRADFPNAQFNAVEESGIDGLYMITSGTNVLFYGPGSGRLIFGEMLDTKMRNLTEEKRRPLIVARQIELAKQAIENKKLLDTLPLDKAIKIGDGKNIVIEFTDIDCPYCRKVEEFFKNREDMTRYVFLMSGGQLHPRSLAKSKEVLCSKDTAKAYKAAATGGLDNVTEFKGCGAKDKDIDALIAEFQAAAIKMGVRGTPTMWVNKKQVSGADTRIIEQYLAEGVTGTK